MRVTVTLADAQRIAVPWSEHFDRPIGDLFAMQDEVATAIASAIEPEIGRAETERARSKPAEDLSAWECCHRAMWHCFHFTAAQTLRKDTTPWASFGFTPVSTCRRCPTWLRPNG